MRAKNNEIVDQPTVCGDITVFNELCLQYLSNVEIQWGYEKTI